MLPMIFMIIITTWGMIANFLNYVAKGNWLLTVVDGIVILLEVWLIVEAWAVVRRLTAARGPEEKVAV